MNPDKTTISFDALVTMAVTEANQRELARLPSAEEMDAEFQPSPRLEKKVEQTLRRCRNAKRHRTALRWVRRTAMAAAALWVVFTGALVPAQAVQQAAYSTLLEWKEQFSTVIVSSDRSTTLSLPTNIRATYLPEGYALEDRVQNGVSLINWYANTQGKRLLLQINLISESGQVDVDNEYSHYYSVQFDDISALWIQNGTDHNTLLYEKDGYLFSITAALDVSELIKVAQGITY